MFLFDIFANNEYINHLTEWEKAVKIMSAEKRDRLAQEIISLQNEMSERESDDHFSNLHVFLWYFTVNMSYGIKRFLDIVLSLTALIVLFPLFLILAILIKLSSPGPVFFVQTRVGRFGRNFCFYKFRSMYVDAEQRKQELLSRNQSRDGVIFKMKDDPRITPIGRVLRKTSMDELPQFLNVLFGDMSLVGPRPPLPSEVKQYSLEARKRLNVQPGLTCLWQVSGRSDIPFKEQVSLDKQYISSRSLKLDLLILLRTIPAILSGRGAY